MDFSRLDSGEQLTIGAGAVAFICLFLPWNGVFGINLNAWDSGILAWGGCLLVIAAAVIIVLRALDRPVGGNTDDLAFYLSAGGLALILLRFISRTEFARIGVFLAIVAGAVATWATYQSRTVNG